MWLDLTWLELLKPLYTCFNNIRKVICHFTFPFAALNHSIPDFFTHWKWPLVCENVLVVYDSGSRCLQGFHRSTSGADYHSKASDWSSAGEGCWEVAVPTQQSLLYFCFISCTLTYSSVPHDSTAHSHVKAKSVIINVSATPSNQVQL